MHSKLKGNIGELSVAAELAKLGYCVFKELGDLSKIDLIAEKDGRLIRFQVKYISSSKGKLFLSLKKDGPNYTFYYKESDVDIFAVFWPERNKILYVPSSVIRTNKSFIIRVNPTKNNMQSGVHFAEEFFDLEKILRDFTPCISPSNVGDNDKVQTTKEEIPASEN